MCVQVGSVVTRLLIRLVRAFDRRGPSGCETGRPTLRREGGCRVCEDATGSGEGLGDVQTSEPILPPSPSRETPKRSRHHLRD